MPPDRGIFELKTPRQLFNKLINDANQLAKYPADSSTCFNFFVTAEHLPEWYLPGDAKQAERTKLKNDPLLRICSHIANGAKHFEISDKRHNSIESTAYTLTTSSGAVATPTNESDYEFIIVLSPPEAAALGCASMTVRQLATKILDFWEPLVGPLPMFDNNRPLKLVLKRGTS